MNTATLNSPGAQARVHVRISRPAVPVPVTALPRPRLRTPEGLLLGFVAGVLAIVAIVAMLAAGGAIVLVAAVALVLVLAGLVASAVFALIGDEDGTAGG